MSMRKSRIVDSTRFLQDFKCKVWNQNLKDAETQTGISITLSSPANFEEL